MSLDKINMFLIQKGECFNTSQLVYIKTKLNELNDNQLNNLFIIDFHKPTIVLIFSILIGSLGVDRFLIGQTGLGIAKLLTCGGLGIWTIIDWFIIMDATKEENIKKFERAIFMM